MEPELKTHDELLVHAIGIVILQHMKKDEVLREILAMAETEAMQILDEIRQTLEDDTLEDPECFQRIKAILRILEKRGIGSLRHDW
ncbi:hypothetical protein [uncultured Oscillibacter sp.]|uniref:hypothetical protein n=1 Tax=uncultured Oscillibacter sp. TaxID=876091 RepID=UPI0025F1125C|nr:hypothetical protein [uncultured Oscillibacter sp.]